MRIIKKILTAIPILVILLSFYIIITTSISLKNRKVPHIFGYSYMTVASQSMEPVIKKYDFIIVKNTKDVKIDDFISFYYDVDNDGIIEVNTHKIIEMTGDNITTWGVNNNPSNVEKISKDDVVGKVVYTSTFLGQIFSLNFIQNKSIVLGIIIFTLIIFIIIQIINIKKILKEKENKK